MGLVSFELNLQAEEVRHAHPVDVVCVEPDATIRSVLQLMKTENTGNVLICQQNKLTGIFTERDALRLLATGIDLNAPVDQVMVKDPVTVQVTDTVKTAISKMATGGYRRLPVVDQSEQPIGMLKVSGILHYLVEHVPDFVYTLPPEPHHRTKTREGA